MLRKLRVLRGLSGGLTQKIADLIDFEVEARIGPDVPPQGGGGYTNPPPPSGGEAAEAQAATGGTSGAPAVVSVNIHSDCSNTVKVFYGDKPKFGSGTYSTISSHSSQNRQFKPGDMVWIVDDAENGLASTTIGAGMAEINIGASCTSFVAR